MVNVCKYCGKRFIPQEGVRKRFTRYCSMRCNHKKYSYPFIISFLVIALPMVGVTIWLASFHEELAGTYEAYFPLIILAAFSLILFSGLYGLILRLKDKEKDKLSYTCHICKAELKLEMLDEINLCTNCEQKIPSCALCTERIFGKDKVFQIETCNHLFHQECLYEWLNNNDTCPICNEKIKEIDMDITDDY